MEGTDLPNENSNEQGTDLPNEKVKNGAQTYQIKIVTIDERDTDVPNENRNESGTDLPIENGNESGTDLPNESRNERGTDLPNEGRKERGTDLQNEDGTVLNLPNLTTSARGGYGQRSLLQYRFFYFHIQERVSSFSLD